MMNKGKELIEYFSRIGRPYTKEFALNSELKNKLKKLKRDGYVTFDHLVGTEAFTILQNKVKSLYEKDLAFKTPCLAQNHIDYDRDADFIARNFLVTAEELKSRNLVFNQEDVKSYDQVVQDFAPSTLTLPIPKNPEFYNIWLDQDLLQVIEAYMGFTPILREAYIRRNFPCQYTVMNHKWHRDTNHRHHLLKAFIFFTDCDIETGAHHYIAGSVQEERFRENRYFEDDEIETAYPLKSGKQIVSTVPAGTIILEDTRGLHKAGIPKRDFRDLGFAVFVPGSVLHRNKSYYNTNRETVNALTPQQQLYIPSYNITS